MWLPTKLQVLNVGLVGIASVYLYGSYPKSKTFFIHELEMSSGELPTIYCR